MTKWNTLNIGRVLWTTKNISLLDEVMLVKNNVDNLAKERNKYRSDIQVMQEISRQRLWSVLQEAQRNAEVLAMEIDEQFQNLGQKLEEEIKSIEQNLSILLFDITFI